MPTSSIGRKNTNVSQHKTIHILFHEQAEYKKKGEREKRFICS